MFSTIGFVFSDFDSYSISRAFSSVGFVFSDFDFDLFSDFDSFFFFVVSNKAFVLFSSSRDWVWSSASRNGVFKVSMVLVMAAAAALPAQV